MATFNTSTAAKQRLHLLGLPQEIQLMIFGYAYARPSGVELITAEDWRDRELGVKSVSPASASHIRRPFPEAKVVEFLVSTYFFAMAAKTYVTSRPISHPQLLTGFRGFSHNIFVLFAKNITCALPPLHYIGSSFNVKTLAVHMAPHDLRFDVETDDLLDDNWILNRPLTRNDCLRLKDITKSFRRVRA